MSVCVYMYKCCYFQCIGLDGVWFSLYLIDNFSFQAMVAMAEWLARVNEWLKAQNPGSAIADGAGDMGLMSEDLKVRIWHLFVERETGQLRRWQH